MKTTRILLICIVLLGLQSLSAIIADGWRVSRVAVNAPTYYSQLAQAWQYYYNSSNPLVVDSCLCYHRSYSGEPTDGEFNDYIVATNS